MTHSLAVYKRLLWVVLLVSSLILLLAPLTKAQDTVSVVKIELFPKGTVCKCTWISVAITVKNLLGSPQTIDIELTANPGEDTFVGVPLNGVTLSANEEITLQESWHADLGPPLPATTQFIARCFCGGRPVSNTLGSETLTVKDCGNATVGGSSTSIGNQGLPAHYASLMFTIMVVVVAVAVVVSHVKNRESKK